VPAQYHILEIEQSSVSDAQAVIAELYKGTDFRKIATERTTRTGMQSVGGDLGFVSEGRFPALYKAAQGLDINQWSDVIVNTGGHFSVIKLLEAKPKEVLPLEQVQNRIRQEISDLRRASAALDWLAQAREDASIEVREDVIEKSIKTSSDEEQS
jgi:parvulin-like peptidyl-prolyl isomerase